MTELKTPIADTIAAATSKATGMADTLSAKFKDAVAGTKTRATAAYEKSTAVLGEIGEFSKGNFDATIESGKILSGGLQAMGQETIANGKSVFETATADLKSIAAVKSPADFFAIQGKIMQRNLDAMMATGAKQTEAMVKLANDTFAPLSSRISVGIEKIKKAA